MNRDEVKAEVKRLSSVHAPDLLEQTIKLLHENFSSWNWVGIYLFVKNELHLGPSRGKPTEHTKIAVGVGVCGSAVMENRNIIVDDVTKRENYLACTLETKSELVVLIRHQKEIVGQFDIDSDQIGAFSRDDELFLEELAPFVSSACKVLCDRIRD